MLDEIVSEFLIESYDNLDQLDRDLLALEESPDDRERMASILRTIHTIKGTSGFLALPKLERVTHVGESLLVPLRDGELSLSNDIANSLLSMVDAVRTILRQIELHGNEGENEHSELIHRLKNLKEANASVGTDSAAMRNVAVDHEIPQPSVVEASAASSATLASAKKSPAKRTRKSESEKTTPKSPSAANDARDDLIEAAGSEEPAESCSLQVGLSTESTSVQSQEKRATSGQSIADSSVRIDVDLLDRLMNLVGELVLSGNQVLQFAQDSEDPTFIATSQRLNLITSELQAGVMKTRMQPIRNAWAKLPRVVRDLSRSLQKQVQVVMEGAETEFDKTILEAIKAPLTHIVRNSVDHGIETTEERTKVGKPAVGTLFLRAFHEDGQVIIEIADDGRGICHHRVRQKAIDNGLVTAEQAAAMSESESTQLILLPGFSTAVAVTKVSGRGVGMDVVKTNVEKIGGTLEIQSERGKGTTLRIKIPLALAIIPALIVTTD